MRPPEPEPAWTIRPARDSDIREVAELWSTAFPGRRTIEDRVRMLETGGRYGGLETVLVAREATRDATSDATHEPGRLAGAAKIYQLQIHLSGVPFAMMGLAAVAVDPTLRRRGLGATLCGEAIRAGAARGDLLSVLYPFRADYYERLGWGLVGELHDHRFRTAALPAYSEARHVRPATREEVADCYARVAARSNGPLTRDAKVWAYRLAAEELGVRPLEAGEAGPGRGGRRDPGLRAVVYDDGEGATGYALLRFATRRNRDRNVLEVRELVAESEAAYRGLLGHVASQAEEWPHARHFARPEERFSDRLRDPRPPERGSARSLYFPTARIVRGPMLRVLDVPGALRKRRWFDGPDASGGTSAGVAAPADGTAAATIRITVLDEQRPENRGPWWARVDHAGSVEVVGPEKIGEASAARGAVGTGRVGESPDGKISSDPATFARIFCGEISVSDAARIGAAEASGDLQLMDRAFATRERFWLLDEF